MENTSREAANLEIISRYLQALTDGAPAEALAAFFDKEVIQHEFPNRLVPGGAKRDLAALLASAEQGKKVIRKQRYEVRSAIAKGDRAALEVDWSGILARPLGALPEGYEMRARFAVFFVLREGRILSQHNYDCFEPW